MSEDLTGSYWVRVIRPALHDAHHWLPRTRDRAELRRQALKLRFWPDRHPSDDNGQLLDLDWSWIKSMPGKRVGELRISDTIGNCDNLRIIFFDPQIELSTQPLPVIWVISAFQKKRDDFTVAQLKTFNLRRTLVLERFYK